MRLGVWPVFGATATLKRMGEARGRMGETRGADKMLGWYSLSRFFAVYRSLSPMTVRQRFRYLHLVGQKILQAHRPPNETELRKILAEILNEFDLVLRAIGGLTVAWAETDMFLDYINGILAHHPALAKKRIPRTAASLDQKINFLRDGFKSIPELADLCEKIRELIAELERLQPIRNDVVHGVASERAPVAVRKVMRVKAKGNSLDQTYKTYEITEIIRAGADTVQLRNKLIALFADTFRVLYPDQGKQFLSELPSLSTIPPPQSPVATVQSPATPPGLRLKAWKTILLINAFAGLLIGMANASWFDVLHASLIWGLAAWLGLTLISDRASKGNALLFGSGTITRSFIRWSLNFVLSLIAGSLTYAIRAFLGPI